MSTAPKNKRLSQSNRYTLVRFARKQIQATQDRAELDAAYEAAADAVHAEVVRRWPQKEMKVLAKYDCASPDRCLNVAGADGEYSRFQFREDDKRIALRPSHNCRRYPIQLEGEARAAFERYEAAVKADEAATLARLNDFRALIDNTTSFNALAEVWPAAEALRVEIVGQGAALSTLSDEVVERIKSDPALALAA